MSIDLCKPSKVSLKIMANSKEAKACIKINKLLDEEEWRFFEKMSYGII